MTLGIPDADPFTAPSIGHVNWQNKDRLHLALVAIIQRLGQVSDGHTIYKHEHQLFPVGQILRRAAKFDPAIVAELRELREAIDAAIDNAYANGEESGSNLLKGLATGKTSINEFNEATIKGTDD